MNMNDTGLTESGAQIPLSVSITVCAPCAAVRRGTIYSAARACYNHIVDEVNL